MDKIKLAVDYFGGDNAPEMVLDGLKLFLKENKETTIYLYGPKEKIEQTLKKDNILDKIKIIDSKEGLDMGVKDVSLLLRSPDVNNSLFNAMKDMDKYDGLVSAGPTQAIVAGSHFLIGRIPTIRKVALAPIAINFNGVKKLLLDVGANPTYKPEQLLELGIIGIEYAKTLFGIDNPTVGLLNIGTEEGKGREFEKEMNTLLKENKDFNYIGFVEADHALNSDVRVILTQGFEGNIFIKSMEAVYKAFKNIFKEEMKKSFKAKLGLLFLKNNVIKKMKKASPKEVGGALVLGCKKIVVKAHGSSDAKTYKNALQLAYKLACSKVVEKLNEKYK